MNVNLAKLPAHIREMNADLLDLYTKPVDGKKRKSVNKKPKDVAPIPLRAVCVPWGHITASQFDRLACPECGKPIAHAVTRVDVVKYVFKCGCEFERRIVVGGKCE